MPHFSCTRALRDFPSSSSGKLWDFPLLDLPLWGEVLYECHPRVSLCFNCSLAQWVPQDFKGYLWGQTGLLRGCRNGSHKVGHCKTRQENLLKHMHIFNNNWFLGSLCTRTHKESSVMSHCISHSHTSVFPLQRLGRLVFWILMFAISKFGSEGQRVRLGQLETCSVTN